MVQGFGAAILAATASVKVSGWECNVSASLTRALLLFHILNVFVILHNKILAGPLMFVKNRALCPVPAAWARVIFLLHGWLDPQAEGTVPLVSGRWLTVTCFNMPRLHWPMACDSLFLNPNFPWKHCQNAVIFEQVEMTEYTCVLVIKNIICSALVILLELHQRRRDGFFSCQCLFSWVITHFSLSHMNILFIIYKPWSMVCLAPSGTESGRRDP